MPNQGRGAPFLERVLRTGKKWQGLMGVNYPGGLGQADPHSIGGTAAPPARPTPSGEPAPASPAAPPLTPPITEPMPEAAEPPAPAPGTPGAPESDFPFPWLDDDMPTDVLHGADSQAPVLPAITLGERFYRRYGRLPGPMEAWMSSFRMQYETKMGRPPTKIEIETALNVQDRRDVQI